MSAWARFARQIDLSLVRGTPFQSYSNAILSTSTVLRYLRSCRCVRAMFGCIVWVCFSVPQYMYLQHPLCQHFPPYVYMQSIPLPASETAPIPLTRTTRQRRPGAFTPKIRRGGGGRLLSVVGVFFVMCLRWRRLLRIMLFFGEHSAPGRLFRAGRLLLA